MSLLLKTQTYITQAIRSTTCRELALLAKVTDYVGNARRHGRSLPVIDGVDLTSVVDEASAWTNEWRAGVDEALAQLDTGRGQIYLYSAEFFQALDPQRAVAEDF